jgi:hypothetical protein
MELTQLAKEMLALEQQAAVVGRLLKDADEELLEEVAGAWAPLMPKTYHWRRWSGFWIAWLQECSERVPCANRTCGVDTPENGGNWTTDWPQPFSDGLMHPVVTDAQSPDAAVGVTH